MIVGVCLSISVVANAAVDSEKSQSFFEAAVDELREQNINAAVIQLRNALQQDTNNLPARIKLGEVLLIEDQPLAAIKELEMALSLGGDENLVLPPLGRAYLAIAKPEQVITSIVAQDLEPEAEAEVKLLHADAYLQLGSLKDAEAMYLEATALAPIDPRPLLGKARIDMAKGRIEQANKLIEQAIALAPGNFDILLFKAKALRDVGSYDDAVPAFEQALEVNPGSVSALTARAALWMDLGQIDKAKLDLEAASNFGPDSLETLYLRSVIAFGEGKSEEAREILRGGADQIRQIKGSYRAKIPNTILMLGVVAFFEENYDEAITHLTKYLLKVEGHPGAKRYLASAYLAKQEWENIIKMLTPKTGYPLRDPFLLSILAEASRGSGDFRAAERYYAQALEIAPDVAGIGIRLAENRLDAGRPEKAIAELEKLIERFPDLMEAHAQLLRVYVKMGNKSAALNTANTLVEEFPDQQRAFTVASGAYLVARDFDRARGYLEQAILLDPEALSPNLNLARLAVHEGKLDSAQAQYRATLERFPQSFVAKLEFAELLFSTGQMAELQERLATMMSAQPNSVPLNKLELNYMMATEKDPDKIRARLYSYSQKFASDAESGITVGKGYLALGDLEDAKLHFRRAVDQAQFDTDKLFRAANLQMTIRDYNGALWTLTKAAQASPDHLQVAILQAAVLMQLEDFNRAHDQIEKTRKRHGDLAEINLVEGDLHMKEGNIELATAAYEKAWELKPAPKTVQTYFRSLVTAQRYTDASQLIKPWIKKYPQDFRARRLYAEMLTHQQDWVGAKEMWEGLQSEGVEDLALLNNLAAIYQRLSDPRALPTAELIYSMAPENAAILDTYGWILTQNGQVENGLAILREAYARASTQPEIRFHIGEALASLGRTDEAREEVQAALDEGVAFTDKNAATDLLKKLDKN